LKLVLFESFDVVSYSPSTVTMALSLSCIISDIKRYIGRKSRFFIPPCIRCPITRPLSEYWHTVWHVKTRIV